MKVSAKDWLRAGIVLNACMSAFGCGAAWASGEPAVLLAGIFMICSVLIAVLVQLPFPASGNATGPGPS